MQFVVDPDGTVHCIYAETLDLETLGPLTVKRASHVEPTKLGQWTADLGPVGGPTLGPFAKRSEALAAELDWLEREWMSREGRIDRCSLEPLG
jgi:hypothetical protein